MVTKKNTETKLTIKMLGTIVTVVLAVLGSFATGFACIDNRYVNEDIYKIHIEQSNKDLTEMEKKTAQLIVNMQNQSEIDLNRVYKAIKDASALPLIVRRDVLLARSSTLSSVERDELAILNTKLDELNIE